MTPKVVTPKKRTRCPKGTRKNKQTGNCDPVNQSNKINTETKTKKSKTVLSSPKKTKEILRLNTLEDILQRIPVLRDTLFILISKVNKKNLKELSSEFNKTRDELKQLVKQTGQAEAYKELISYELEYHFKKNTEKVTKNTDDKQNNPEMIYDTLNSMIQEAVLDERNASSGIFIKKFNDLRKELKELNKTHNTHKYSLITSHTLNYYVKKNKNKSQKKTVKSQVNSNHQGACDTSTICQYGGSCWFVSIFLMFAKIKVLYDLITPKHQEFVDGLLVCPIKNMGNYCKIPPSDIWSKYKEKFKKHTELHKLYKNKDSAKIDESFKVGGFSFILFKVIMKINNVYYLHNHLVPVSYTHLTLPTKA